MIKIGSYYTVIERIEYSFFVFNYDEKFEDYGVAVSSSFCEDALEIQRWNKEDFKLNSTEVEKNPFTKLQTEGFFRGLFEKENLL